ncbi:MAG TPA: RNA polymerase factor sigma-54, partial [Firmicutes bacterium]|nr:RNA polymerase factor sigma-54 [Bacillota bacterium]
EEEDEKNLSCWEEYFQEQLESEQTFLARWAEKNNYENYVAGSCTLQEHLLQQLGLSQLSPRGKMIGEFIVGNINHNGYLVGSTEELSSLIGASQKELERVLEVIQTFEPAGVGARSLRECLLIQLGELEAEAPLAREIVAGYLPQVADNRLKEIAAALNVDVHQVQAAVDIIRSLDPKPGCSFGGNRDTRYLIADLIVEKVNNEYIVLVNDSLIPRLTINSYYRSLLQRKEENVISSFIRKRLDSALWLIRSIEHRRLTLYRVMEQIVKVQAEFFAHGINYLKPLTLKEVAEETGVHESTVSRAASNKYVQTPRGLFPLKFFFSSGLDKYNGESVSSSSIKYHLRELVGSEDASKPLSDQKMAGILRNKGILISRRTVSKYRKELNIPASGKRKRHC